MLKWALVFLLISLVAGVLGFTGIAAGAAAIAKILFFSLCFSLCSFWCWASPFIRASLELERERDARVAGPIRSTCDPG